MLIAIVVISLAILICFLLAVANFAGERFMEKFQEMDKIAIKAQITPLQFVEYLNNRNFQGRLKIIQISQVANDRYGNGNIFLSTNTLSKNSLASYSIIAHELGHAKQDFEGKKLKRLSSLRRIGKMLGVLMFPLLIAGGILALIGDKLLWWGVGLMALSLLIFIVALFIKLRTISIEKEASKFALDFLKSILQDDELKKCKKFLDDARLTYWSDFLRALLGWTMLTKKSKLFN